MKNCNKMQWHDGTKSIPMDQCSVWAQSRRLRTAEQPTALLVIRQTPYSQRYGRHNQVAPQRHYSSGSQGRVLGLVAA